MKQEMITIYTDGTAKIHQPLQVGQVRAVAQQLLQMAEGVVIQPSGPPEGASPAPPEK
jgi:hypothetical protein